MAPKRFRDVESTSSGSESDDDDGLLPQMLALHVTATSNREVRFAAILAPNLCHAVLHVGLVCTDSLHIAVSHLQM